MSLWPVLYIYISGLSLTQLYNLLRAKMNPGLYNDVIILGNKREKKINFFFLQLDLARTARCVAAEMFICQPTLLQKVEYF